MSRSPFGSYRPERRERATTAMLTNREVEIDRVERVLARTKDQRTQRRLALRLRALRNNHRSWLDYQRQGSPRVKGATVEP
jgi:hypothetical protein